MSEIALHKLHRKLNAYGKLDSKVNTLNFIKTVDSILSYKDTSSLPHIFKHFRDDEAHYCTFESIKHGVEGCFAENYVSNILQNIHILIENAPEWASFFLFDILHTPSHLKDFQAYIYLASRNVVFLENLEKKLNRHKDFAQAFPLHLNPPKVKESSHA